MAVLFPESRVVEEGGAVRLDGWPCTGPVTSPFGARDHAAHAAGHAGVDIGAAEGAPVCAPAAGLVRDIFIDARRGTAWDTFKDLFGNAVILDHLGSGFVTLYAHLRDAPAVREGEVVEAGRLLGYVGSTGTADGPHLHWGMAPRRFRGGACYLPREAVVDPLASCATAAGEPSTREALAGRVERLASEMAEVARSLREAGG